jgi:hypothetical protein
MRVSESRKRLWTGILVVPVGLSIILAPYSLLIGWNLVTLFLFWFVVIPLLATYLPPYVSGKENHLMKSLAGLMLFYLCMVFMIYDHYQSDYFKVMMISAVINMIVVVGISRIGGHSVSSPSPGIRSLP